MLDRGPCWLGALVSWLLRASETQHLFASTPCDGGRALQFAKLLAGRREHKFSVRLNRGVALELLACYEIREADICRLLRSIDEGSQAPPLNFPQANLPDDSLILLGISKPFWILNRFFLTNDFSSRYILCRELKAVRKTLNPQSSAHDEQALQFGLSQLTFGGLAPAVITVDYVLFFRLIRTNAQCRG